MVFGAASYCSYSPFQNQRPNNVGVDVKAVIRELGESKGAKLKIAKDARKIAGMKGKQIKDAMSLARYDTTVYEAT